MWHRTAMAAGLMLWGMMPANKTFASPATEAHVLHVGVYGTGTMFILLDQTVSEPGCESAEIRISPTHPQFKTILALAMSAAATESRIRVKTELCTGSGYPQIGETTLSLFSSVSN